MGFVPTCILNFFKLFSFHKYPDFPLNKHDILTKKNRNSHFVSVKRLEPNERVSSTYRGVGSAHVAKWKQNKAIATGWRRRSAARWGGGCRGRDYSQLYRQLVIILSISACKRPPLILCGEDLGGNRRDAVSRTQCACACTQPSPSPPPIHTCTHTQTGQKLL